MVEYELKVLKMTLDPPETPFKVRELSAVFTFAKPFGS